jgi:hypothetical protein
MDNLIFSFITNSRAAQLLIISVLLTVFMGRNVLAQTGCQFDEDCLADENCDTDTGKCVSNLSQSTGCQFNEDCLRGELCDRPSGTCIKSQCATDNDCPGRLYVCREGAHSHKSCELVDCLADTDCSSDLEICQNDGCVRVTCTERNYSACKGDEFCNQNNHSCQPKCPGATWVRATSRGLPCEACVNTSDANVTLCGETGLLEAGTKASKSTRETGQEIQQYSVEQEKAITLKKGAGSQGSLQCEQNLICAKPVSGTRGYCIDRSHCLSVPQGSQRFQPPQTIKPGTFDPGTMPRSPKGIQK